MANREKNFQLTVEDKKRYEKWIRNIDLSSKETLINNIPWKLELLRSLPDLKSFQVELINDISALYNLITTRKDLNDFAQRRILFAFQYFYEIEDEIPDKLPWVGYLDDAVVVRWVMDSLIADHCKYFET